MKADNCTCLNCGAEFYSKPSRIVNGRGKYCSRKCKSVYQRARREIRRQERKAGKRLVVPGGRGTVSANWRGGPAEKKCIHCGTVFFVKQKDAKNGRGKFCSRTCAGEWASLYRVGDNAFHWRGGPVTQCCEHCHIKFEITPGAIKNGRGRFCSRKCFDQWRSENERGEVHWAWRGGPLPYPPNWHRRLKERIRSHSGYICATCGKKDAKRELSIHHIDYDKNNLADDNLIALCMSCHSKTNARRLYWQGLFQTGNYQF